MKVVQFQDSSVDSRPKKKVVAAVYLDNRISVIFVYDLIVFNHTQSK